MCMIAASRQIFINHLEEAFHLKASQGRSSDYYRIVMFYQRVENLRESSNLKLMSLMGEIFRLPSRDNSIILRVIKPLINSALNQSTQYDSAR